MIKQISTALRCGILSAFFGANVFADQLGNSSGMSPSVTGPEASEKQIELCQIRSQQFASEEDYQYFVKNCFQHFLSAALPGAVKYSEDRKILAFGHQDLLFAQVDDEKFVIGGKSSQLKNIREVAIDKKHAELVVLDKEKILYFELGKSGNLAPKRGLLGPWIKSADSLSIAHKRSELYLLNSTLKRILVYDLSTDMLYKSRMKKAKAKREHFSKNSEVSGGEKISVCEMADSTNDNLVILDQNAGKLTQFKLSANSLVEKFQVLKIQTGIRAQALQCRAGKIEILNSDGRVFNFEFSE